MSDQPEAPKSVRGALVSGAIVFYGLMAMASLWWLRARDREPWIAQIALGDYGIWVAAGCGLCAGLVMALAMQTISGRSAKLRACEAKIAGVLGPLGEAQLILLTLASSIAEELFFRVAVQDVVGFPLAVVIYTVLNTGPGFLAWAPIAAACAALFGGLVAGGFGLLAATTAHAVVNYLSLRRIAST